MSPKKKQLRTSSKTKRTKKTTIKPKSKSSKARGKIKKPVKVLVVHDNKTKSHTTKAHKLAKRLEKDPNYKVIYDKEVWKKGEKTSSTETDRREREMVKKADVVARIVPSPSKTGSKRNIGALREVRKAIRAGKPVVEIYEKGGKTSSNRATYEKNYGKRVPVHLKPGEKLVTGFKKGMREIQKKKK